jgi:hypothetical protein
LSNDRFAVQYVTSAYSYARFATLSNDITTGQDNYAGSANNMATATIPMGFTSAQLTNTTADTLVEGRIVSATLRLRYNGSMLNQSGLYIGYNDPDGGTFMGSNRALATTTPDGYQTAQFLSKDAAEITNAKNDKFVSIHYLPAAANQQDFPPENASDWRKIYPYAQNQVQYTGDYAKSACGIMLTGVSGQSYYWEVIIHAEYIGAGVTQSLLTESTSDVLGYDAVSNCVFRAQRNTAATPDFNFVEELKKEIVREGIVMCPI